MFNLFTAQVGCAWLSDKEMKRNLTTSSEHFLLIASFTCGQHRTHMATPDVRLHHLGMGR
jgi:hypothetical protein